MLLGLILLLFVLLASHPALAADKDIGFALREPNPYEVIGRPNTYDYEPSVLVEPNGDTKVYVCGGEGGRDHIYLTAFNSTGKYIDSQRVLTPLTPGDGDDSLYACNPGVVKHSFANLDNGAEKYLMYYECAPNVYSKVDGTKTGTFTQICLAVSNDGISWQKYNQQLWQSQHRLVGPTEAIPPTAVIPLNDLMFSTFGISKGTDGKWYQSSGFGDINSYGSGHPSVIVKDGQIWVYFYDSVGNWNDHGIRLTKTTDALAYTPRRAMNQNMRGGSPKYFAQPVNGYPGVFIAFQGGLHTTVGYNYSYDGVNWAWTEVDLAGFYNYELKTNWSTVTPANNRCFAPGPLTVATDPYGQFHSQDVSVFSNEGYYGINDGCTATNGCLCYSPEEDISRGATWQTYAYRGRFFTEPTPRVSAFTPISAINDQVRYNAQNQSNYLSFIANGSYSVYGGINFGSGATNFTASIAGCDGGTLEARLGHYAGQVIASCTVPAGNCATWVNASCNTFMQPYGVHDIVLRYSGGSGWLYNLRSFQFTAASAPRSIYTPVQAEDYQIVNNAQIQGWYLAFILNGSSAGYYRLNFGTQSPQTMTVYTSGKAGGTLTAHLDYPGGFKVATCSIPSGNLSTWNTTTCNVSHTVTGLHDIYFAFTGIEGDYLYSFDWFRFNPAPTPIPTITPTPPPIWGDADHDGDLDWVDLNFLIKPYTSLFNFHKLFTRL